MAHAEHQVHLSPGGEVETHLEVGFAHGAKQIGPVRQIGVLVESEGDHLLNGWKQLPSLAVGERTGHLNGGVELFSSSGQSGETLELLLKSPRT